MGLEVAGGCFSYGVGWCLERHYERISGASFGGLFVCLRLELRTVVLVWICPSGGSLSDEVMMTEDLLITSTFNIGMLLFIYSLNKNTDIARYHSQ